ncbi:Ribosome-binding factor A [Polystyrenella longa]|uniref:Ribosome-binding factor A n=1 Tax=Polystyrenella longa TaxID=2528007 RepID=A0A518CL36_9PLAN|nr:30S ribosome-binding factor RbfA [Polystyrenella longa]QDU79941.1 Ribosome-binding factor A [Polystyrenella longa]
MSSRRLEKLAQAIKEQVSTTILLHMRDPRVKNVTVTGVEVSPDVRSAKVLVSVLGTEKEQSLCMHGLESARGFLQAKVGDRIQTRYTPILSFKLDEGIKRSFEAARILKEIETTESGNETPDETGDEEPEH